jgi:hypothetical protein
VLEPVLAQLRRRPSVISLAIVLVYAASGWIWFKSPSTGILGTVLCLPYILAYAAAYDGGGGLFWFVLIGQFILIWFFVHQLVRAKVRT